MSLETNSWRVADAKRASLIIDADDYFQAGRLAMLAARRRIMLIGWDFDARIRLGGPSGLEGPEKLGDLILWLVKRRPELEVYLLRWDIGAIRTLFRGTTIFTLMRWMWHDRIHTRLDAAHPTGASHHQKIVVIDDCFAFCGGIDMTSNRWDTSEHRDRRPTAPLAGRQALRALARHHDGARGPCRRGAWRARAGTVAGGRRQAVWRRCAVASECWPANLTPDFDNVRVAISRSMPAYADSRAGARDRALYLDLIARARRFIYAESQYFSLAPDRRSDRRPAGGG